MPRKSSRKGSNKNSKNSSIQSSAGSRVETICGRQYYSASVTTAGVAYALVPSNFPRASAISDVFQFYRFRKFRVTVVPQGTANGSIAIGYSPGVLDSAPDSFGEIMALPSSHFQSSARTIDGIMNLSPRELISDAQIKWYKTVDGTADPQFETQGSLYIVTDATTTVKLIFDYEIEFQSWALAANTPKPKTVAFSDVKDALPKRISEPPVEVTLFGNKYVMLPNQ